MRLTTSAHNFDFCELPPIPQSENYVHLDGEIKNGVAGQIGGNKSVRKAMEEKEKDQDSEFV